MDNNTSNTNTLRIRKTSRRFIGLLRVLMVLLPLADAAIWIFLNDLLDPMQEQILPGFVQLPLPPSARVMGFFVSLIMVGLILYTMKLLIRLFRLYEVGKIFSTENVRCFRLLSRALIAWCLIGMMSDSLMSVVLTLHHPPGQRTLAVGLGSLDLTALLIGGILAVITRVMEEARKMEEEQAFTV